MDKDNNDLKIVDGMIYNITCPKCGGVLYTDGEWCCCDICEEEIHIEDLYFIEEE